MKTISRRAFLRGAGGVAISLPFLEIMGCSPSRRQATSGARAAGGAALPTRSRATAVLTPDGFPRRFVAVFSANGTENTYGTWRPTGSETVFQLSEILAPLEPHKPKIIILDGVSMESGYAGPGDAHQRGMGSMLTGRPLLEGSFPGNNGAFAGYASGISIDQEIANHVGDTTKFRSLELGVQSIGSTVLARMAYLGTNQPLPYEKNPGAVYARAFADLVTDPAEAMRQQLRRRTVLDAVADDYTALLPKLGAADRQKLDQHLTAVRDIEQRLGMGGGVGGQCQQPLLASFDYNDPLLYPEAGRLQMDLLAMALACDLTRVSTVMFHRANVNLPLPHLGITEGHHDLSHHGDSDVVANQQLTKINKFYAEQFAYLVGKLAAIPEGAGTVLDHSIVLWCNEQGKGNNHSKKILPWVIAGSGGGVFRTGRWIKYTGSPPHNNLFVSFLNAFGIETNTFGDPMFCTGPLGQLT